MAMTEEETRVTMSTSEGAVETTLGGLARTADALIGAQLSFEIGGELPRPGGASFAIGGKGMVSRELFLDDDVTVQIVDAAGEVVASFAGSVVAVDFKKHRETDSAAAWVERVHRIKLEDG